MKLKSRCWQPVCLLLVVVVAMFAPLPTCALILTGQGNAPVSDAGWPDGALAVANLKTRVRWSEGPPFGGGEWSFQYRGDTEAFNQALTNFAAIRAPALELIIHDGPAANAFGRRTKEEEKPWDWNFTVWNPEKWHFLFSNPKSFFDSDHPNFRLPLAAPKIDVYVGSGGQIDWSKVKVPAGVQVKDQRAASAGVQSVGGAVVRVDVYDIRTGKTIPGARVVVARMLRGGQNAKSDYETVAEAVTDATGRAQVEKIPAGTARVMVAAEGYAPRMLGYESFHETSYKFFQTELAKVAQLEGTVRDTEGHPVKGVTVRPSNSMGIDGHGYRSPDASETITDAEGKFAIVGLPTGFSQLWVHSPDYHFGDIFTLYDVPTTNINLRIGRAGKILVTVLDGNGQALSKYKQSSIMVNIEPTSGSKIGSWGGSATIQEDGTYEFKGVPAGEYRLTTQPNPSRGDAIRVEPQIITVDPGGAIPVTFVYR